MAASTLVRTARRRANLTQAQLAERAGLSQAEVARLERAGSNPTAATLERLLRATGHRLELAARSTPSDETQLRERLDADAGRAPRRVRGLSAETCVTPDAGARRVGTPRAEFDPTRLLRALVDARRRLRRHRRRGGGPARIRSQHVRPRHLLRERSAQPRGSRRPRWSACTLGCGACAERRPLRPRRRGARAHRGPHAGAPTAGDLDLLACALGRPTLRRAARARRSLRRRRFRGPRRLASRTSSP